MFSSNTSQVSQDAVFIEDVMSTFLYTGNGSTQTINNGIDLAGKGGLVWTKARTGTGTINHGLWDTSRGVGTSTTNAKSLSSNTTNTDVNVNGDYISAFGSTGFSLAAEAGGASGVANRSGSTYASWTFRKQPKFFDVVTYTGTGANRTVAHNLGSVPGCIIVKRTDTTSNWQVYHNSLTSAAYGIQLNLTNAQASDTTLWNSTAPTSAVFSLGANADVNSSGGTYVAYIFAHNAGGFGLTGTDNVISCGSFTTDGSGNATVNLGYEPQWVLIKSTNIESAWWMLDTMRGWNESNADSFLRADSSVAENGGQFGAPTSTGFFASTQFGASNTFIYIAIRRGPMKVPTDGTKVFAPITATDTEGQGVVKTTNFPVDLQITKSRASSGSNFVADRLRRVSTNTTDSAQVLITNNTDAETSGLAITRAWNNTGFQISGAIGNSSQVYWNFRRAPGFFDEVCYTGTGTTPTSFNHNLGVVPELMIVRNRNGANWAVYSSATGAGNYLYLNLTNASAAGSGFWANTAPTSSVFTVGGSIYTNGSGNPYVAYLFASCPGVSKVGSYTGTGTTQQINCGFTGGARFVLIKRTDSTGDWYVWDSARGIVAGNDPYLLLNSATAEVTSTDYIGTYNAGFEISSTAPAAINASGGTFIYLAIA